MDIHLSITLVSAFVLGFVGLSLMSKYSDIPFMFNFNPFFKDFNSGEEQLINHHFSFYAKLSDENKRVFQHRVMHFISNKEFVSRNGIVITPEMKLLIASTAVMITFGMKRYLIESVSKIIIYPSQYFSEINGVNHLGEYNPIFKTIVFSWEDFLRGLENPRDNMNLGIHEFAHAVYFNSLKYRDDSSILFAEGISQINNLLNNSVFVEKVYGSRYLRNYGKTNKFEFFAVCLESFIETPNEFLGEFPELYFVIRNMINFQN